MRGKNNRIDENNKFESRISYNDSHKYFDNYLKSSDFTIPYLSLKGLEAILLGGDLIGKKTAAAAFLRMVFGIPDPLSTPVNYMEDSALDEKERLKSFKTGWDDEYYNQLKMAKESSDGRIDPVYRSDWSGVAPEIILQKIESEFNVLKEEKKIEWPSHDTIQRFRACILKNLEFYRHGLYR